MPAPGSARGGSVKAPVALALDGGLRVCAVRPAPPAVSHPEVRLGGQSRAERGARVSAENTEDGAPSLAARNHGLHSGDDFSDTIELPGWEEQSIWGWDPQAVTFYAQLWKNENDGDTPDVWLSGVSRPMGSPGSVVREVAKRLHKLPFIIANALGLEDPDPVVPSREAATKRLRDELDHAEVDLAGDDKRADFVADLRARGLDDQTVGALSGLLWLAGRQLLAPASFVPCPPLAHAVTAERLVAAGRVVDDRSDPEYFMGVHRILRWDGVAA